MVCGIVYYVGIVGKYVIEKFIRIFVEVDIVSEFRYRDLIVDENIFMIVIF